MPLKKHKRRSTNFPKIVFVSFLSLPSSAFVFFSLHHLNAWNKLRIKILTHCSLFCFSVFLHSVCKFHWFSYQHCYSLQEKRQTFCLRQKCTFSFFLFFARRLNFTLNHCLVQSTGNLASLLASQNKKSSNSFFFPQTEFFIYVIYPRSKPVKTTEDTNSLNKGFLDNWRKMTVSTQELATVYCLKKQAGQNSSWDWVFKTDIHSLLVFLNSFNISDIDKLILALILSFGVILV